jgi:prepilin-type N-terminal cleavage/methylation domain-containing protein
MNCQKHYRNQKGFSVIELIVVVAVFLIFMAISEWGILNFKFQGDLNTATNDIVQALRHAKANAQQVQGDSKWGVEISAGQITVFEGTSYAGRNSAFDQIINLPNGVSASGLSEVVFEKISGITSNTGTITLTNSSGTKDITINAKGTVSY